MTNKLTTFRGFVGIAVTALALTSIPATANNNTIVRGKLWQDIGASERVDYSGRLRMLSQRIAASSCNLEAGVETTVSRGLLAGSADEVDRILKALRSGNALMKIVGEEKDARILRKISAVEDNWTPVRAAIKSLLDGNTDRESFERIEQLNLPLFEDANILVSEISGKYSNPADLLQGDAVTLTIAGRQRMNSQVLLKNACQIWKGDTSDEAKTNLMEAVNLFDLSHNGLRFGVADVGIAAAPNAKIAQALTTLDGEWSEVKGRLVELGEGKDLPDEVLTEVYLQLNEILIQSTDIVRLYATYSKHVY